MDRRTFLRGVAATSATVGSFGTASVLAQDDDETVPVVTTRNHFEATWYREVERNEEFGPEEYETEGTIPAVDTDETPDEMLVFAHGWLNDAGGATETFRTARAALRSEGYEQPVVGYSYDADTLLTRWWQATEIAERNGPKLAAFLSDVREASPSTDLRLVGHSLGGRVLTSTLQAADGAGAASVSLLGAAVDADDVAVDGEYGDVIGSGPARVDNFYYRDDAILEYAYSLAEWEHAVGQVGCDGPEPETYADFEAGVSSHLDYYDPDRGCMDQVVESFE